MCLYIGRITKDIKLYNQRNLLKFWIYRFLLLTLQKQSKLHRRMEDYNYNKGWWDCFLALIEIEIKFHGVRNVNVAILKDLSYTNNVKDDDINEIIKTDDISDDVKSVLNDLKFNPQK